MNYYETQFFRIAPFPLTEENQAEHKNGRISLKLHSPRGETKWMDITPEQAHQIELILSKGA